MPDALHKYAAGNGYLEKSCVLDIRGNSGIDQYIHQSQNFGQYGWFYSCHRYRQRCCVSSSVLCCGVIVPACPLFFGKTHCRLLSVILDIFLIVLIVVTFVVWMAPVLEPYDVPNFNVAHEMYPVVLTRLMIFEWLFYCFFCRSSKNAAQLRVSKPWFWGSTHLRFWIFFMFR